jgi:hypothetical protein
MPLEQLIYASRISDQFVVEDIDTIIASAQHNNKLENITGALLFISGEFLQLLEGEPGSLTALLSKIMRDNRHTQLRIRHYGSATIRLFNSWSMTHIDAEHLVSNSSIDPRIFAGTLLDISPASALDLFDTLSSACTPERKMIAR